MQFAITAYDGEHMLDRRMAVRPRHLENLSRIMDRVVCAGGLLDAEGRMKGSLMILDFDTREDLDAYLASEPYIAEGVWADVRVERMNVVISGGEKAGG